MPAKQPFRCKRFSIALCCVQHHFHNAFHASVRGHQGANIKYKPSSQRRAHLSHIKGFPLNGARLHHIQGQSLQASLCADGEAKGTHPAQEQALLVANGGKLFSQRCNVPLKCRPVWTFVNIAHNRRTFCGEYGRDSPQKQYSS